MDLEKEMITKEVPLPDAVMGMDIDSGQLLMIMEKKRGYWSMIQKH